MASHLPGRHFMAWATPPIQNSFFWWDCGLNSGLNHTCKAGSLYLESYFQSSPWLSASPIDLSLLHVALPLCCHLSQCNTSKGLSSELALFAFSVSKSVVNKGLWLVNTLLQVSHYSMRYEYTKNDVLHWQWKQDWLEEISRDWCYVVFKFQCCISYENKFTIYSMILLNYWITTSHLNKAPFVRHEIHESRADVLI
jgi:hypothetical protein